MLSDHKALLGWIRAGPAKGFKGYLRARKTIPWKPPTGEEHDVSDYHFERLTEAIKRTKPSVRECKPWISDETWRLVDERGQRQRAEALSKDIAPLNHQIRRSL